MAIVRRATSAFPRQWNPTQAPSWPVEIDPARAPPGLTFCLPFGVNGCTDLVSGCRPVINGSPAISQSAFGPALNSAAGFLAYPLTATGLFSFEILFTIPNVGGGVVGWDNNASASSGIYDHCLGTYGGNMDAYVYSGASIHASGSPLSAYTTYHAVATNDGTDLRLYVNGSLVATAAAGLAYTGYSTPYLIVGKNALSGAWPGQVILVNAAIAAWSAAQVADRYAEPFAMLRPVVRRTYSVPAGGTTFSAALTDTSAGSDVVTGTGAASDTLSGSAAATASLTAAATSSDTIAGTGATTAGLTDTAASSDALAGTGAATASLTDSATSSGTVTLEPVTASLTDTAVSSDSLTGAAAATAVLTASAASSDLIAIAPFAGALTDRSASSDSLTPAMVATAALADTTATSDNLSTGGNYAYGISDSAGTTDSLTETGVAATAASSDTAASADNLAKAGQTATATLTDAAASADSLVQTGQTATASLTDTSASSDSLSLSASGNYTASINDTAGASDVTSAGVAATAALSDISPSSDQIIIAMAAHAAQSDTAATADSIVWTGISIPLTDTVAATDALTASLFATIADLTDTAASTDSLTWRSASLTHIALYALGGQRNLTNSLTGQRNLTNSLGGMLS